MVGSALRRFNVKGVRVCLPAEPAFPCGDDNNSSNNTSGFGLGVCPAGGGPGSGVGGFGLGVSPAGGGPGSGTAHFCMGISFVPHIFV